MPIRVTAGSAVVGVVLLGLLSAARPLVAVPLAAQAKSNNSRATPATAGAALIGGWSGTATVPLPDSVIVVPVLYTYLHAFSERSRRWFGAPAVPAVSEAPREPVTE